MASSSPFTILPCTVDDLDDMITVYTAAFSGDYLGNFTFPPSITPAVKHAWISNRIHKTFSKPDIRNFKAVETSTGKLVAWCRWGYPYSLSEQEKAEKEKEKQRVEEEKKEGRDSRWPDGANLEVCDAKFGGLERFREEWVVGDDMYVVYLLCTDPAYQRKGLATLLLKHGLDIADAEGRKTYIEATLKGHPVYLKLGFKDVDKLSVDLTKWGGKEPGVNWIMLRDPQPSK